MGSSLTMVVAISALWWFGWGEAAKTYMVGDALNWVQPPTFTTYSLWASSHVFLKQDVLVFNFNNGIHNVAEVTKDGYKKCNKSSSISIHSQSPVRILFPVKAKRYFISTLNSDCENGLKLAINVLSHLPPSPPPSLQPSTGLAAAPRVDAPTPTSPTTFPVSTLTPGLPHSHNSAPSSTGSTLLFYIIVGLLCLFSF